MANEYLKLALKLTLSENADYTDPEWVTAWSDYETEPDESQLQRVIAATSAGTTLNLDHLTAATTALFVVQNTATSAADTVSVTVRLMGDADDADLLVHAGEISAVSIDPVTDPIFVANSSAADCKVMISQNT